MAEISRDQLNGIVEEFIDGINFAELTEDAPSLSEIELNDIKRVLKGKIEDFEFENFQE